MRFFVLISRLGTRFIAGAVLIGLLFPTAAAVIRPWLGGFVICMFTVSLLRVDFDAFTHRLRSPVWPCAAAVWIVLILPAAILSIAAAIGPPFGSSAVLAILFLYSGPATIVSAPAFAMLMGLDGALVLAVLLITTVLMPLTAPWLTAMFVADVLPLGALELSLRLAGMIGLSFLAVALLRRTLGRERIAAAKPVLDTLMVVIAILFAVGAMDGVTARFLETPLFVTAVTAGSFAFGLAQMALTYALFRPFVGVDAVAIAYSSGSRNAGLLMAALGVTAVNDTIWLFFALSQLPLFFFPLLLKPLGRRLTQAHRSPAGEAA